jgi:hypothetical protein
MAYYSPSASRFAAGSDSSPILTLLEALLAFGFTWAPMFVMPDWKLPNLSNISILHVIQIVGTALWPYGLILPAMHGLLFAWGLVLTVAQFGIYMDALKGFDNLDKHTGNGNYEIYKLAATVVSPLISLVRLIAAGNEEAMRARVQAAVYAERKELELAARRSAAAARM